MPCLLCALAMEGSLPNPRLLWPFILSVSSFSMPFALSRGSSGCFRLACPASPALLVQIYLQPKFHLFQEALNDLLHLKTIWTSSASPEYLCFHKFVGCLQGSCPTCCKTATKSGTSSTLLPSSCPACIRYFLI